MKIEITHNSPAVRDFFKGVVDRQMPFAIQQTINSLAFKIREETILNMQDTFDKPKPNFTLRSMEVEKATSKQAPEAWVGLRKKGGFRRALAHELIGGSRAWKKVEGAFTKLGVLPEGMQMVPSRSLSLDSYGNIPLGLLRRLLKEPWREKIQQNNRVRFSTGSKEKGKNKGGGYFVVHPGDRTKLNPGIWLRDSTGGIEPVILFTRKGRYRRAIDLADIAQDTLKRDGSRLMTESLMKAIAGDRRLTQAAKMSL